MNDSLDVSSKYIAAGSHEASAECLEEWAADSQASVRRRVAENPRTPIKCLSTLAKDSNSDVRIAVSENPSTPENLLVELSDSADEDVRYSMAENHNLTLEILTRLSNDENPYVAHRALSTLKRVAPIAELLKFSSFDKVAETMEGIWQVKIS